MMDWIRDHQLLMQQIGIASVIMFVVTLVVLPLVIIKLPADYFARDKRQPASRTRKHPLFWLALSVLKNLLGLILILAGLAMLVLPGQGTLTILIGMALINFPGKYTLERRLASQPAVARSLDKIRRLAGRPPFQKAARAGTGEES